MLEWIKVLLTISTTFTVIDGDTVRLRSGESVRLVGYNTPEIHGQCQKETDLALKAKSRLQVLARGATLRIVPGNCAYGRKCGTLTTAGGVHVGELLVSEGLAEPLLCPAGRCPPRRSWCG